MIKNMHKPDKIIDVKTNDDLEQIEEDIIEAADKAGKRNVIVNIFAAPGQRLKRRWNVRYKFNKKHLVMDLLIALGVLLLVGLNIFWAYGGFHYFFNRLDLSARVSNNQVVSGEVSEIIIEYANRNKFEIQEAVLSLTFPKYFILEGVDRENYDTRNNVLVLGNLSPGANGRVVVRGKIFGNIKEDQAVFASINYFKTDKKGGRLWGQFRKNSILEYRIESSPLVLESIDFMASMVRGQTLTLPVKIKNTSKDQEYKKLQLDFVSDDEVKVIDKATRELINLIPGEERTIIFNYKINSAADIKNIGLRLHWLDPQWDLVQAIWEGQHEVVDQKFYFENKKVGENVAVNPGDWIDFAFEYKNTGSFTLHNVVLGVELAGDYWEVSSAKSSDVLPQVRGQSLTWTEKEWPRLALIQPGETGEVHLSIKTKSYVSGSSDFNLRMTLWTSNLFESREIIIENEPILIRLNSNLAVQVYPMYYAPTGDQLGRGPLPPKVGETTKYWIFAKLINDISSVENVVLTMELPINVSWSNRSNVPVGDPLVFDPNSRAVSWKVSKLPVKPGNIGFAFEVALLPSANQVGQFPILIQDIKISGRDERTGVMIEKKLGNITSKLIQDTKGKTRDGAVR